VACPVSLPRLRASFVISRGPKATPNTPAVATSSPRLNPNGIPRKWGSGRGRCLLNLDVLQGIRKSVNLWVGIHGLAICSLD